MLLTNNGHSVVHDKKYIFFTGKLHTNVLLDRKLLKVIIIASCSSGGRCDYSRDLRCMNCADQKFTKVTVVKNYFLH